MIPTLLQIALPRFATHGAMARRLGAAFAFRTPTVSVLGSATPGGIAVLLPPCTGAPRLAPFAVTALLGGFTSVVAFPLEAMRMRERGAPGRALLDASASVALAALRVGFLRGRSP
jgi:CrcB protein